MFTFCLGSLIVEEVLQGGAQMALLASHRDGAQVRFILSARCLIAEVKFKYKSFLFSRSLFNKEPQLQSETTFSTIRIAEIQTPSQLVQTALLSD